MQWEQSSFHSHVAVFIDTNTQSQPFVVPMQQQWHSLFHSSVKVMVLTNIFPLTEMAITLKNWTPLPILSDNDARTIKFIFALGDGDGRTMKCIFTLSEMAMKERQISSVHSQQWRCKNSEVHLPTISNGDARTMIFIFPLSAMTQQEW